MATENSDRYTQLTRLADEFAARMRRGERPSLQEYLDRYPDLADDIRDLFPVMAEMEQVKVEPRDAAQQLAGGASSIVPQQQLGDYRILREIGHGGMGVVYEAEQISLGRHVALKVLPAQALLDPRQRVRFEREARAAAQLHHTNIVPVFGVGEHANVHYYVMQFIHGLGLDDVLSELQRLRWPNKAPTTGFGVPCRTQDSSARGMSAAMAAEALLSGQFSAVRDAAVDKGSGMVMEPARTPDLPAAGIPPISASITSSDVHLPGQSEGSALSDSSRTYWQSVARVGMQVADALAYAAGRGILHRDIKPSNLLLDTHGTVWVTDFGLAKSETDTDNLTHTGDIIGTLRYIAPERFGGKGDVRADIYSLGLTLYELLTLRPAFDQADRKKLIKQVLDEEPPRPRKLNASVPRDLETIVLKAIARDPAQRYQAPADLAEDLKRFVEDRPVRARRATEVERLWRWCRRNPSLAALATAFFLSLVLGLTGVTWKWREADRQRTAAVQAKQSLQRQSALLLLDRGLAFADQGDVTQGLFWIVDGLKNTPAEASDLEHLIRVNLAAWQRQWTSQFYHLPQGDRVYGAAFSPDGKWFATVSGKTVRMWDTATGQARGHVLTHEGPVNAVVVSPDGKTLLTGCGPVSGGKPGMAQLWSVASGERIGKPLLHGPRVLAVAFSPDGKSCVTGSENHTARLWDVASGRPREPVLHHQGEVWSVAFSPDGRTVLTGSQDGTAQLWDAATGSPRGPPLQHTGAVRAVAFSPDGRLVLTGCDRFGGAAQLWDAGTGKVLGAPLPVDQVWAVAFSPDGRTFLTGGLFPGARFWDTASRRSIGGLNGYDGNLLCAAFSPDGRTLLTGSMDETARVWAVAPSLSRPADRATDAATGAIRYRRPITILYGGHVENVAYSPDGTTVLTGSDDGVARRWNVASGRPAGTPLRHPWDVVGPVAFCPDGRTIATCSHGARNSESAVYLWNADTGRPAAPPLPQTDWVAAIAFSPDGRVLATGGYDRCVHLWEVATGRPIGSPLVHDDIVWCLAFSPDGQTLAVGTTFDYTQNRAGLRLWNVAAGLARGPFLLHKEWVDTVAWNPQGQTIVTVTRGQTIHLWNAFTGEQILPGVLQPVGAGAAAKAAFSPDGKLIVTAGHADGTIRLADGVTGKPVGRPMSHRSALSAVAFSRDARLLATGFEDGCVQLWDLPSCRPIGPPRTQRRPIAGVAFTPDGRSFLSTARDGSTRVWPTPLPLTGDPEQLSLPLEVRTGMRMDAEQGYSQLTPEQWPERRRQLEEQIHEGTRGDAARNFLSRDLAEHDECARDAEQLGDTFAAIWHLDWLLAAPEPDAPARKSEENVGTLYARRARMQALAGRFDKANADYARAEQFGSPDLLVDWYRQQVVNCQASKRWSTALWYLNRLLATRPKDWTVYADRAAVYGQLKRKVQCEADEERAVEYGADGAFLATVANERAVEGRWDEACRLYSRAIGQGLLPLHAWMDAARIYLRAKDQAGYCKLCRIVQNQQAPLPPSAGFIHVFAKLCLLGPDALDDYQQLLTRVQGVLSRLPPLARSDLPYPFNDRHLFLQDYGALLYRAGRYREALDRLNEGIAADQSGSVPLDWVFLALAHHRLGHAAEAQHWRDKLRGLQLNAGGENFWRNLEMEVLRREAEALN
jgi:WD40 repeat protein/serine/threonine protein kinase/tetratricopeptide (TPR) repeat protein